jgi:hypothetical protein
MAPGTEVQLDLPGVSEPVQARVCRAAGGKLGLAFRQDLATFDTSTLCWSRSARAHSGQPHR